MCFFSLEGLIKIIIFCLSDINQEKQEAEMRGSIENFKRNSLKKIDTQEKTCLPDTNGKQ